MNSERYGERKAADLDGNGHERPHGKYLLYLALGALGVVYGDIGTSPLYAFRESFREESGLVVTPANVLGVLSLIFWSLIIVISIKYLVFVLRADNRGEGGILALTALILPQEGVPMKRWRHLLILLGIFGTALLYGDGMITPAISVLAAVEGLGVATPLFDPYVIPLTIVILTALFFFQRRGTERVGKIFGPVTLLWFLTLAILGLSWIVREPAVLAAVNPRYGVDFFLRNGFRGYLVLGSVFLVVTGGEALYADMGHFGRAPIRLAWFTLVLPSLLLNYFGQGALLMVEPEAVVNPFYHMAPGWALYPLVGLATAATVIASQALITGAFSLAMQSVQLGYLPRMQIEHTSIRQRGQIYIPAINWMLMVACIALVLTFRSSSNLAAAYGVAVTTTMMITTILLFVVARELWHWPLVAALPMTLLFLIVDLAFWGANLLKIPDGGWFPLAVGAIVFTLMITWKQGREILAQRLVATTKPFQALATQLQQDKPVRVSGTAVYMHSNPSGVPPALLHNLAHNKVVHETVIFLSVQTEEIPRVPLAQRIEVQSLQNGFYSVLLHYGFRQSPNVPRDLTLAREQGLTLDFSSVSYFLGRERLLATAAPGMAIWREKLFALMSRNARNATDFFGLPPERVVELGAQIEL